MVDLNDLLPDSMKKLDTGVDNTKWSTFQSAIFDAAVSSTDNLVIEAVAGSGKTTTILEVMRRLQGRNVLFLAFNKSIQLELASRVPFGVTTKTLNALGHGILSSRVTAKKINSWKPQNVLRSMLREEMYDDYGMTLAKILSSARHHGIGVRTTLEHWVWKDFIIEGPHMLPDDKIDQFAEICRLAFNQMLLNFKEDFDFDDQLYLPVYFDWTFPKFDVVFVDEAQDLSWINHAQLVKLASRGARIIAVGDSHQAIYGFRGADTKSMGNLAAQFNARILPLSVCYRCGSSIVGAAQRLVPHIQWAEGAPSGEIIHHEEMPPTSSYEPKAMIVCRNNAPLFNLALQFLRDKTPCHIIMDFAQELTKLIDRVGGSRTPELKVNLQNWAEREMARAERLGRYHLMDLIQDKLDCLLPFCDEFEYALQVKGSIKQLTESTFGPRLSTVHKAKGLEAEHCYILRPDLLPSPRAVEAAANGDEAQLQQEYNLEYVAITRAKRVLHYLPRGE